MARGSTLKYSKKFTATQAPTSTTPKTPSPKTLKTITTVKIPTVTAATKAVSKPTTTRRRLTETEAGKIAQETFTIQLQTQLSELKKTLEGFHPEHYIRQSIETQIEELEEKIEHEREVEIAQIETKPVFEEIIEPIIEPIIEEVIEEPVFKILPEAAAELDISINDKMITQKVNDFEIVNGRVKGSITFMITDQFNPYYYNKEIISYLQLRDDNGITLVLKRNVLRFSETEIDETIFYDESSHEISKIFANSFVWDRDTQPTPFSTKLEFIIEIGKLPDIKPLTAGFMGAGGLGAVAVLVLIGAAFTIKGD